MTAREEFIDRWNIHLAGLTIYSRAVDWNAAESVKAAQCKMTMNRIDAMLGKVFDEFAASAERIIQERDVGRDDREKALHVFKTKSAALAKDYAVRFEMAGSIEELREIVKDLGARTVEFTEADIQATREAWKKNKERLEKPLA